MPWTKLTDQFHDDPRVRATWRECPASLGLHVMALTYSAAHLLDGFIDYAWVSEKIPSRSLRNKAVTALENAGLWLPNADGWEIRNYLRYNLSRAKIEEDRRADAERKARGRQSDSRKSPTGIRAESAGSPPVPTPPHPSSPTEKTVRPEVQRLSDLLASLIRQRDPAAKCNPSSKAWTDAIRLLIDTDGRSPEEVERIIRWCQADGFWQRNILSAPKLREKFTQLVAAAGQQGPGLRPVVGGKYDAAAAAKAEREEAA